MAKGQGQNTSNKNPEQYGILRTKLYYGKQPWIPYTTEIQENDIKSIFMKIKIEEIKKILKQIYKKVQANSLRPLERK